MQKIFLSLLSFLDRHVRILNALLCGKIVNVLPEYDARSEEYLTKVVFGE